MTRASGLDHDVGVDDDLVPELDALKAELAIAEAELIRLQARIMGLRAQRDSLASAVAASRPAMGVEGRPNQLRLDAIRKRTEAIEAILRFSARDMSIDEVVDALADWRGGSDYAVVASTLNLLHKTGRISKIARGRYTVA